MAPAPSVTFTAVTPTTAATGWGTHILGLDSDWGASSSQMELLFPVIKLQETKAMETCGSTVTNISQKNFSYFHPAALYYLHIYSF